jgi:hypothetical protein
MPGPEWIDLFGKIGFPAALAVFLMWRMYKDKQETTARLQQSEDWIKNTLIGVTNSVTTALGEATEAIKENHKTNAQVMDAIRSIKCPAQRDRHANTD